MDEFDKEVLDALEMACFHEGKPVSAKVVFLYLEDPRRTKSVAMVNSLKNLVREGLVGMRSGRQMVKGYLVEGPVFWPIEGSFTGQRFKVWNEGSGQDVEEEFGSLDRFLDFFDGSMGFRND